MKIIREINDYFSDNFFVWPKKTRINKAAIPNARAQLGIGFCLFF